MSRVNVIITVALFLCLYSKVAPQTQIWFFIDTDKFSINTTDVIYEDKISTVISGQRVAIQNVTVTGLKDCTWRNVLHGSDLQFYLNCPRIVAESESCGQNANNTGENCEFVYNNETVKVTAEVTADGASLIDFVPKNVTVSPFDDYEPIPTNSSPLKDQLKAPIFEAFLKKARFIVNIF
ncbi:uncharacterized protein LOC135076299 [Ostrinia nubilalis]|uniref:uncharacterized protein LOC135076299 n=1 Tax=Ostrinia nubilalis TaxID=29057 RepID=UPI0030823EF3